MWAGMSTGPQVGVLATGVEAELVQALAQHRRP